MFLRFFVIVGLFSVLVNVQAQNDSLSIFSEDIFADEITIINEIDSDDIPVSYYSFSQDGSWRIRNNDNQAIICQIDTNNCSQALPVPDVSTEHLSSGVLCNPYWHEDGLISTSPDENWVLFSGCANSSDQYRLDLYSYNVSTDEILLIHSMTNGLQGFNYYIKVLDWIDNNTPILQTGETRTGSLHSIFKVDTHFTDSVESMATQFAYPPYYSSDLKTVYWSEQFHAGDGFNVTGWEIFERNLISDAVLSVAEFNYEEPRAGDLTVGHVIDADINWIVVGDSYPLSSGIAVHFYDRQTHELRYSRLNLANSIKNWDVTTINTGLWLWEYDLESTNTNYLLQRISIEPETIEEMTIAESSEWTEIYLSNDESYLLLQRANIINVYDIEEDIYYSVTTQNISGYQLEASWQADNTIFIDVRVNYQTIKRFHIQIEALSEENL